MLPGNHDFDHGLMNPRDAKFGDDRPKRTFSKKRRWESGKEITSSSPIHVIIGLSRIQSRQIGGVTCHVSPCRSSRASIGGKPCVIIGGRIAGGVGGERGRPRAAQTKLRSHVAALHCPDPPLGASAAPLPRPPLRRISDFRRFQFSPRAVVKRGGRETAATHSCCVQRAVSLCFIRSETARWARNAGNRTVR